MLFGMHGGQKMGIFFHLIWWVAPIVFSPPSVVYMVKDMEVKGLHKFLRSGLCVC